MSDGNEKTPPPLPNPKKGEVELKPFEEWAAAKNTPDWQLASLVAYKKYPIGREVSEKDFDAGLKEALSLPLGGE
jgi:hypothetical protein